MTIHEQSVEFEAIAVDKLLDGELLRQIDDGYSLLAKEARAVEAQIFIDSGYVTSQEELSEEYEPYDSSSTFIVVEDASGVLGATRIIQDNPNGFKTLNDADGEKLIIDTNGEALVASLDPALTAEIGTIAVKKEYRSQNEARTAVKLYGGIINYCRNNGIDDLIASIDCRYYDSFFVMFGDAVKELGPRIDYMGSMTIPVVMNPHKMHKNSKVLSLELYEQVEVATQSVV